MSVQNSTNSLPYSDIALGLAVTGVSVASVNYQDQIIGAISPVVEAALGALTQNTGAVVAGTIGLGIVLDTLTASENDSYLRSAYKTIKSVGYGLLGSTGMVALAKTDIPRRAADATYQFVTGPGKEYLSNTIIPAINTPVGKIMGLSVGVSVGVTVSANCVHAFFAEYKKNVADQARAAEERLNAQLQEIDELITKAEQGDQEALVTIVNKVLVAPPPYLEGNIRTKLASLLPKQIKKLAKDKDQYPSAISLIGLCSYRGIGFTKNTNTAYVCFHKAAQLNEPYSLQLMIEYNRNPWNAPITSDPLTEQFISVSLGMERKKPASTDSQKPGYTSDIENLETAAGVA